MERKKIKNYFVFGSKKKSKDNLTSLVNFQCKTAVNVKIRATYTHDFDIIDVNRIIEKELNRETNYQEILDIWNAKKDDLLKQIENAPEYSSIKNKLFFEYQHHNSNKPKKIVNKLEEYKKNINLIIEDYKNLPSINTNIDNESNYKRINIIEKFIFVAKKYIDIDVNYTEEKNNKCKQCHQQLTIIDVDDIPKCENCGIELLNTNSENDKNEFITAEKITKGDGIKHYEKAIYCFQGKQKNTIPKEIFDMIDAHLTNIDGVTKENINNYSLDNKGRRENTSLKLMENILKINKCSDYYSDIYLICKIYWGWELFDIAYLEKYLLDNFSLIRINLPIQYRLFKELEMAGVDCDKNDFIRLTQENKNLIIYDNRWKKALEHFIENNSDVNDTILEKYKFISTV